MTKVKRTAEIPPTLVVECLVTWGKLVVKDDTEDARS
jgi:hypothetical protein